MGRMKDLYIDMVNDHIDYSQYLFTPEGGVESSDDNSLVIQYNGELKSIFFTINPSDYYWENFGGRSEDQFRSQVIREIEKLLHYYKKYKHIKLDAHIHFEKTDRLHSHGVITGMPISYYPYEGELTNMSRKLHKVFGKPRLRSDISCKLVWCNENWNGSYLVKQNYLKPCRIIYI